MMNPGSPTGIYLPHSPVIDTSAFETPPVRSQLEGGELAVSEGLSSAPLVDLFRHGTELLTSAVAPGKFLSASDYKSSPYFRSDLNFPGGVSENVARLRATEYDQNLGVQEELNNMPSGLTSDVTKFAGTTIGMALDPINLATGYGVSATIGTKSASLLANLAEKPLLQRAASVAVGAVEGTAISTPQALSQYDAADQLGEHPTVASIFATMGLGAGLGGVIRGAIGVRQPVTVEADQMAKQVAVNQLATGKSVHVDEILQNGYNEARNAEPTIDPDNLVKIDSDLNSQVATTTQSIADEQSNLNNLIAANKSTTAPTNVEQLRNKFLGHQISVDEVPPDSQLADQIKNGQKSPVKTTYGLGAVRNEIEASSLADYLPQGTDELYHETSLDSAKKIISFTESGARHPDNLSVSPQNYLALGQQGKGVKLVFDPKRTNGFKPNNLANTTLEGSGQGIGELIINKSVPRAVKGIIVKNSRQLESLKKENKIASRFDFDNTKKVDGGILISRKILPVQAEKLTPEEIDTPDIINSRQRISDLTNQKSNLENEIHKNRTLMAMTKDAVPPLESSQIKNANDYMRSYKSDSAISEAQDNQLTNELKDLPDDPLKDLGAEEEQITTLKKNDLLDEVDKENLDRVNQYDSQLKIFTNALKRTINCLKEG